MIPSDTTPPASGETPPGASAPSAGTPVEDPLRSPMTGGGGGPSFDAIETAEESKIPPGVAVLLLVMLVGGGSIMLMRQFGLGGGYTFDEITIDYPIDAQTVGDSDDEYEQIISDLTNHDVPHVSLSDLRPKPFELFTRRRASEARAASLGETEEERREREARERRAQLQREFQKLELNSVIGGSAPIARISGVAVRPGDRVAGLFTVTRIAGRTVELEADGRIYQLTMGK